MKNHAQVSRLSKAGISTTQACNFIGDCLVRRVTHYVPMISVEDIPGLFPTYEPLLYSHLLPRHLLTAEKAQGEIETDTTETPTTLLAAIVGLEPEKISGNSIITSFGLDSLGGMYGRSRCGEFVHFKLLFTAVRFSSELKTHFNIKISQAELLGSATIEFLDKKLRGEGLLGLDSETERNDSNAKYGAPLTGILNDRNALGEPYSTKATLHQYRMWLAQVRLFLFSF
jgi:hypothetical protein